MKLGNRGEDVLTRRATSIQVVERRVLGSGFRDRFDVEIHRLGIALLLCRSQPLESVPLIEGDGIQVGIDRQKTELGIAGVINQALFDCR